MGQPDLYQDIYQDPGAPRAADETDALGPSQYFTDDDSTKGQNNYSPEPSEFPVIDPKAGQLGTSPCEFACDQCPRVFDQIHKLNHHKRYHDRPHECPYAGCAMRFGTKVHLDRHINDKHNKTRKFFCTQANCPYSREGGKSFPRKDNWRRHLLNKHQITPDFDPGPEYVDDTMESIYRPV